MDILHKKLHDLKENIASLGSLAVGFSGGVDSSFLIAAAHEVLGDRLLAVTVRSPFSSERDLEEAVSFCGERGIRHCIADFDPLSDETIRSNPPDRCYHCKLKVFDIVTAIAREEGIDHIAEGSNVDDLSDYRPGSRAVKELKLVSPLQEAGLTKEDIRMLSREMGLPTWEKPSAACLASRVPYGEELTAEKLAAIDAAEAFLKDLGFGIVRVRAHGDLARIELSPEETGRISDEGIRKKIDARLKSLGFTYVTVDLAGYSMGSLNRMLP